MTRPERKFILDFKLAPGDVSMLTPLVRDLKLTHGDRYAVDVRTNFPAIWRHNPHLTKLSRKDKGVEYVKMRMNSQLKKAHSGEMLHYVRAFHNYFREKTGIQVPCLQPKADFHFSTYERENPLISGRYWVIIAGGKTDMTTKWYSPTRLQEVVNRLREWGLRWVQEGATKRLCWHPPLKNVMNVVGTTSVRDIMVNILHADGLICPITFPMHIAGATDTPCVVVAGGREEPWWEAYCDDYKAFGDKCEPVKVPHQFLHTVGQFGCCQKNGCWHRRVTKLNDKAKDQQGRLLDNSRCSRVRRQEELVQPACLEAIHPDHIIEATMSYYEQGYLPPPHWNGGWDGPHRKSKRNVQRTPAGATA